MNEQEQGLGGSLFDATVPGPLALDPGFRPLALGVRRFRQAVAEAVAEAGAGPGLAITLEQDGPQVARLDLDLLPASSAHAADNLRYASWMLNGLLWSQGGWRISLAGPAELCAALRAEYLTGPSRRFEREILGQAYTRPLEVRIQPRAELAAARPSGQPLGGHLQGYRLGFDLGASDYKIVAVKDGEVVYSSEQPWQPKDQSDPAYHYQHLDQGLRQAAGFLPRVDAIGGSCAGILVDNEVRVSSLFRSVPAELGPSRVRPLFRQLQQAWGVPLEVINDGDVTALAGGLSLEAGGLLGIALGSSEAAGFLDHQGRITGWLNELAFAPVDANPQGGSDDWSGNPGVGAAYFSQQAVDRLAGRAGLRFAAGLSLAERLVEVQAAMAAGHPGAAEVFRTLGHYLGYTLPWYQEFYPLEQVMILGRVTSGPGGTTLLATAQAVLDAQFPELAARIRLFLPDEKSRRVGQAVAAASLPRLP